MPRQEVFFRICAKIGAGPVRIGPELKAGKVLLDFITADIDCPRNFFPDRFDLAARIATAHVTPRSCAASPLASG